MSIDLKKTKLLQAIGHLRKVFGSQTRRKILYQTGADISNFDYILKNDDLLCALLSFYHTHLNPFLEGTRSFQFHELGYERSYAGR